MRLDGGRYLERWVRGDPPVQHVWQTHRVLWLIRFGDAHSLNLFWNDETEEFVGWYVNLQAPLTETPLGFDTTDWALDVWVEPDASWWWKDEEDFAELRALGAVTDAEAAAIRAEGERVIAELPARLPTGWEDWRPDPSWSPPALPARWDRV